MSQKRIKQQKNNVSVLFQAMTPETFRSVTGHVCRHTFHVCESVLEYHKEYNIRCPVCDPEFDYMADDRIVKMKVRLDDGATFEPALVCVDCHDEMQPRPAGSRW
jgi:hypothetical protein